MSRRMRVGRMAIGLVVLVAAFGSFLPAASTGEPAAESQSPRTLALLISCTEYPMLEKHCKPGQYAQSVLLDGCDNDVELMARTLRDRFGVPAEDIIVLQGRPGDAPSRSSPTRKNILGALARLAKEAGEGDRVIVQYSGHGDRVPDDDGDESEGEDEVLLPADVDLSEDPDEEYVNYIRDDDFYDALCAIHERGALVWVVMDCCHSATGIRGFGESGTKFRRLEREDFGPLAAPGARSGASDTDTGTDTERERKATPKPMPPRMVAFYAAQAHQTVPEVRVPRDAAEPKTHGLLTYVVAQALQRAGPDTTFRDLYQQVVGGYCALRKHQRVQPLADGDLSLRVFREGSLPGPALSVRRKGRGLVLDAGSIWGIAPGARLAVFAPGRRGDDEARVGTVEVEAVELDSARCVPSPGSDASWVRGETTTGVWPANLTHAGSGALELPVTILDESGATVDLSTLDEGVRRTFEENAGRFPVEVDPGKSHWHLVVGADGALKHLAPASGGADALRFEVDPANLEALLFRALRAENVLRLGLQRKAGGAAPWFTLEVLGSDGEPLQAAKPVPPGEELSLRLRRRPPPPGAVASAANFDVYVIWVDPHYGIWPIFPPPGHPPRITFEDADTLDLPSTGLSDEHPGMESLVVFARPVEPGDAQLDLGFLVQRPMDLAQIADTKRKGVADPVADALRGMALGQGQRGPMPVPAGAGGITVASVSWRTAWGPLSVPQRRSYVPHLEDVTPPVGAGTKALARGSAPSAWSLGGYVRLEQYGHGGVRDWCYLASRHEGTEHFLVDFDGGVGEAWHTPEGLRRLLRERKMDAEFALRVEPGGRRTAWYDTDDDGSFDLILVDEGPAMPKAEVAYLRSAEGWTRLDGQCQDLVTTRHLTYMRDAEADGDYTIRAKAIQRLRWLLRP